MSHPAVPEPAGALRAPRVAKLAIAVFTAAGFALTLQALYPGYLTNDATFVYGFIKEWRFGDWQSPVMSLLWWLIDPIAPGTGSMFLLVATLYWLGFAVTAVAVARRSAWIGMSVPLLALMPPAFMMLVMIWRDMLFGVAWLLAAAIVYAAATAPAYIRRPVQCIALALIAFGVLLRPTAIIAAPLLATYVIWPTRFDGKRAVLAFLPGLVIGFAIVHLVYYVILDVKRENPLHSLLVFDLGGITHFTGENQFPVSWSAEETALLTSTCYNDERWDSYWTMEPCRFVMRRLEAPDDLIFGTPRLPRAWLRAVTAHPGAYLRHRLTYFRRFLAGPSITLELYHANDPTWTPLARNPYFRTLVEWHDALKASVLFRPGFWLMIAALTGALGWRLRRTPSGAFAVGVTSSAVVFVLTFFPFGVAAEFRYGYWSVLAALVGAAAALAAAIERRRAIAALPTKTQ